MLAQASPQLPAYIDDVGHPIMFRADDPVLARVRQLALSLPSSAEKISHGRPTFYTTKNFAYYGGSVKVDGIWVEHEQSLLVLRPALAVAARDEREQRDTATVLPQKHRPVRAQRRAPCRGRRRAQRPTPQDPRLETPRRGTRRATVNNRSLKPLVLRRPDEFAEPRGIKNVRNAESDARSHRG